MLRPLLELLVWGSVEGSWHLFVRACERNAARSQEGPYDRKNRFDDPVYKKNLQRLIERNRQFEDAKE